MPIPRKMTANFVATEVDDEVLIVDLDGGILFSLEGSARAIWQEIDGMASVGQIAESMARKYQSEGGDIAGDIADLLRDLEAARIIDFE